MLAALTWQLGSRQGPGRGWALAAQGRGFFMSVQQFDGFIRRTRWGAISRVAMLGIAALIAGCRGEAAVQDKQPRPVKVAIVAVGPQGRTLSYSGVVRPR